MVNIVKRLKDIMLDEAATNHKPYSEMTKQEFKAFHKQNFEARNKWSLKYMKLFIKNFKHIFPEGVINLKKGDKGFKLSDLNDDQILDAWSFNQRKPKSYMYDSSNNGKEVDADTFFMNVLSWTEGFAPRSIDNKMEQVRDLIMKKMDQETINSNAPFDISIIGDWDDLKSEGFFDSYPHLK